MARLHPVQGARLDVADVDRPVAPARIRDGDACAIQAQLDRCPWDVEPRVVEIREHDVIHGLPRRRRTDQAPHQ